MSSSTSNSSTQEDLRRIQTVPAWNPWTLWVEFRRNFFWSTLLGAFIAFIGAFIVYGTFRPEYCANHILEANREYVVNPRVLLAPVDFVQTEKPLIYNKLVLGPVLADAKVCKAPSLGDPIKRESNLRRNMSVRDAGTCTLMEISYKDTDPVAAATVCNAIARSYLHERQRLDDRRIEALEQWLAPAVKFWTSEVEESRKRIVYLSKRANDFDWERFHADGGLLNRSLDELGSLRTEEAVLAAELELCKNTSIASKPTEPESLVRQQSTTQSEKEGMLSSVQMRRAVLEKDYDAEMKRLSNLAGETFEFYLAQQKYLQATSTLAKLDERVASIRTERVKDASVQTLSEAVAPTTPEESIPWKKMLLVAGIAFVISVVSGFLKFLNTALWKIWGLSSMQ